MATTPFAAIQGLVQTKGGMIVPSLHCRISLVADMLQNPEMFGPEAVHMNDVRPKLAQQGGQRPADLLAAGLHRDVARAESPHLMALLGQ